MPPQLGLQLLGPPQIQLNHEPVTLGRRKALAILAYLAVESSRQTRDSLSALFWPDYDQSRAYTNLRHILWEIQQTIGEGWLIADREAIEWKSNVALSLDVREFEALLRQSQAQADVSLRIPLLSDAVQLYRNHFLTGFSLKDTAEFNEWAFAKSEGLRHQLASALAMLSEDHAARGQADHSIPHARRLVSLDPLNESSHRLLMQVYMQAGQHSAALKQYQACEEILRRELGVDPQFETRDLYRKIRKREIKPVPAEKPKETSYPRHNLPLQISSFIGREKEQKAVAKLIAGHRLVTLIGAGGIGKTRLSLKVGEGQLSQFPDGIWFVELAPLADPALVLRAVSTVLDITEQSDEKLFERLVHFLKSKKALLILDNCEHLVGACAQLAETLLANCPVLKILATSREALEVVGEALYPVPSLSLPRARQDFDQVAGYESIRLFTDRARLTSNEFMLSEESSQVVAEICRRLDGMPLAIELAAARVDILSVEQIAARLQESFRLLTNGSRTKLPRQQTLLASIDWSWQLLSETERILLQRLSIFTGGWTLEGAEAVCSAEGIESEQVLGLMTQLVRKSLVIAEQQSGRERRYHLLEMIRQYAREKLAGAGDERRTAEKHLLYFLDLSEKIDHKVVGPQQAEWFARAKEELENLRAALTFASKNNHVESGLYLSSRLHRLWESFNMQEGIRWLAEFTGKPESKHHLHARAKALCMYSWLLIWRQQFTQARPLIEEALELFRAQKDSQGEANALMLLGNIIEFQGDMAGALEIYQQALTLSQSAGHLWSEAQAHFMLGYDRRNIQRAFDHLERSVSLFREVGDWASLANVLGVLSTFRVWNGDVDLAQKHLDEAAELWRFSKRVDIWENAKVAKSRLALLQGDPEQAEALLRETLVVAEESGNRMAHLWNRTHLAHLLLRTGDMEQARQILMETMLGFQKDGNTMGVVFGLEGMVTILIASDKPEKAARLIGCADATREKIPDIRPLIEEADMYRNMIAILSRIGPSGFEITYDEGRSMTLDEAVTYALGDN